MISLFQIPARRKGLSQRKLASIYAAIADLAIPLYRAGKGHKTIAKELGISPKTIRTVLIKSGEWKPGSLFQSNSHRKAVGDGLRGKTRLPAWRAEEKEMSVRRKKKRGITKLSDLPLFEFAARERQRPSEGKKHGRR